MSRTAIQQTELSGFFTALASPVRLRILEIVTATKRPLHIKAISDQLKTDYAATYRHVSVLKKAMLIEVYEVGRSRVVSPKNEDLVRRIMEIAKQVTV